MHVFACLCVCVRTCVCVCRPELQGETSLSAACREVEEEVGLAVGDGKDLAVVATLPEVQHYTSPPGSWLHSQVCLYLGLCTRTSPRHTPCPGLTSSGDDTPRAACCAAASLLLSSPAAVRRRGSCLVECCTAWGLRACLLARYLDLDQAILILIYLDLLARYLDLDQSFECAHQCRALLHSRRRQVPPPPAPPQQQQHAWLEAMRARFK